MEIKLDEDRCSGHGRCYTLAPSLFDADEQGHAVVLVAGSLSGAQLDEARTAVLNCPEQAIDLVES